MSRSHPLHSSHDKNGVGVIFQGKKPVRRSDKQKATKVFYLCKFFIPRCTGQTRSVKKGIFSSSGLQRLLKLQGLNDINWDSKSSTPVLRSVTFKCYYVLMIPSYLAYSIVPHVHLLIPCYQLVERFNKHRSLVFRKPKLRVVSEADWSTATV